MRNKSYLHEEMLLCDKKVFKSDNEFSYRVTSYDGFAIGVKNDVKGEENCPKIVYLTYPKLNELTEEQKQECLAYRGIEYGTCNYEDVCMLYRKITTTPTQEIVDLMVENLVE